MERAKGLVRLRDPARGSGTACASKAPGGLKQSRVRRQGPKPVWGLLRVKNFRREMRGPKHRGAGLGTNAAAGVPASKREHTSFNLQRT